MEVWAKSWSEKKEFPERKIDENESTIDWWSLNIDPEINQGGYSPYVSSWVSHRYSYIYHGHYNRGYKMAG